MSGTTTTTQTQTLLPGAQGVANKLFETAQNVAAQPYTPYTGTRVEPFNPQQQQAFDLTSQIAGKAGDLYNQFAGAVDQSMLPGAIQQVKDIAATQGGLANLGQSYLPTATQALQNMPGYSAMASQFLPITQGAAGAAGNIADVGANLSGQTAANTLGLAQTFPNANIAAYMSPYTESVLAPAMQDLERQSALRRNELASRAARTGSFGGSRAAVAEGEIDRNTMQEMARLSANERQRAFESGAAQYRADQTILPQLYTSALNQLGQGQGLQRGAADIAGLGIGQAGALQGMNAATIDATNRALSGVGAAQALAGAPAATLQGASIMEQQRLGQLKDLQAANTGLFASQVNPLLATGGLQQGLGQQQRDIDYQNFTQERDWQLRGLEALRSALGMGSMGASTTTTAQQPRPNATAQTVGSIAAGLGALPSLFQGASSLWNLGNQAYNSLFGSSNVNPSWAASSNLVGPFQDNINPDWVSSADLVGPFYGG